MLLGQARRRAGPTESGLRVWAGEKEKERPAGKEGWVGFSHGLGCFGFGLALGFGLLFYF